MKNVPKLRFNGFSDEWDEKKLGDFLEFYSTNSLSRECLNYESGKIRNIHYGDIHMKFPTILDVQKEIIPFINKDIDTSKIKEDSYCKDGDLIIADASEDYNDIGKAIEIENIAHDKILAGLHTILARDTKGVTAKRFKGYLLLNDAVRKQIKILAAGAKVLGISKTNLVKVTVKLPSKEEQEKIANFLTKVDKLIEKQDEKVSNLEQYKKGMMQKVFSQKIRFKKDDGGEYPGWEKKKINDIAHTFIGLVTTMTENYVEDGVKLIRNSDIKENKVVMDKLINLDKQFAEKNESRYFKLGDVVTVHTGDIGTSAVIEDELVGALGFATINTRPIKEVVNSYYLAHYFNSYDNKKYAIRMSTGDGRSNYNLKDFDHCKVKLPCLEEQTKIVNFLSNIDSIVEKEKEKVEELRLWKKGLLQQMFV